MRRNSVIQIVIVLAAASARISFGYKKRPSTRINSSLRALWAMPPKSVDCAVTSPPYWAYAIPARRGRRAAAELPARN